MFQDTSMIAFLTGAPAFYLHFADCKSKDYFARVLMHVLSTNVQVAWLQFQDDIEKQEYLHKKKFCFYNFEWRLKDRLAAADQRYLHANKALKYRLHPKSERSCPFSVRTKGSQPISLV